MSSGPIRDSVVGHDVGPGFSLQYAHKKEEEERREREMRKEKMGTREPLSLGRKEPGLWNPAKRFHGVPGVCAMEGQGGGETVVYNWSNKSSQTT